MEAIPDAVEILGEDDAGAAEALAGFEGAVGDVDEEEVAQLEAQLAASPCADEDGGDEDAGEGVEPLDEALAASPADDEEEPDTDEEHLQGVEVEAHLKDAVEGSLRLKRLLSRDDDDDARGKPAAKKLKVDPEDAPRKARVRQLLLKWGLGGDLVSKHVLDTCNMEELETLHKSGYMPDLSGYHKTPAELLAKYCAEQRERKLPGGSACDSLSAFKFRWKLDLKLDKVLRALCHKDLRYILNNYDGAKAMEECVKEAAAEDGEFDNTTATAVPDGPGVQTLGRFNRLELIDPLADAAVFGDANLTFSIQLARHRKALGHVGRVVATTFEELPTLRERYAEVDESIKVLEEHFAEVYHGVDCTRIAIDPRFKGMEGKLGAVYYNFPHSGAIQGFFDGHPVVNWRHENLMRLFFRALRSFVKPGGFVKVASNSHALGVRYSYIVGSALENEFHHIETMPFLDWHLHRYGRSYGDKRDVYKRPDAKNNQSYNAQAADRDMVYCFCYAPTGGKMPKQQIKLPPTLKTLKGCTDGPFKNRAGHDREQLAKQLHHRFITEVSGTHVG